MGPKCSRKWAKHRNRGKPEESHPSQPITPAIDQPERSGARLPADSATAPSSSSYSDTFSTSAVPETSAALTLSVPETSSMASSLDPMTPTRYMRGPTCHLASDIKASDIKASDIKANSHEVVTHMLPAEDSIVVCEELACTLESLSRTYVGILPASQQSSDVGKSGVAPDLGITTTCFMTNLDSSMTEVACLKNNEDDSSAVSSAPEGDFVTGDNLGRAADNVASTLDLTAVIESIASNDRETSASQSLGLTPPSMTCSIKDVQVDVATPDILSMHNNRPLPLSHPTESRPTTGITSQDVAALHLVDLAPRRSNKHRVPSPTSSDESSDSTEQSLVSRRRNDGARLRASVSDPATVGHRQRFPDNRRARTYRQPPLHSAWEVYTGGLESWNEDAAMFGLDQQPMSVHNLCDCLHFGGVCQQYLWATFSRININAVHIERYDDDVDVLVELRPLLYLLPEDMDVESSLLAWRRDLVLLCVTQAHNQRRVILPSRLAPRPGCRGLLYADCYILQCQISPDLAHTAVLFDSDYHYYLFIYDNANLHRSFSESGRVCEHCLWPEIHHRYLLQVVRLSQDDSVYFAYDPRYRHAQLAVTSYESAETGRLHEVAVLRLAPQGPAAVVEVQKTEQALLPRIGDVEEDVDFNLLYSRDGDLLFLQKVVNNDQRPAADNHIYVFSADQLTLLKYFRLTQSKGVGCRVISEPAFSPCGNFMRLIQERDGTEMGDNQMARKQVFVYRLPPPLRLTSQCRRAILSILPSVDLVRTLPVSTTLKAFLNFEPSF